PLRQDKQLSGFGVFHKIFSAKEGLGPLFINSSCGGCHVNNGRGPLRFPRRSLTGSTAVIKIALRGLNPDGSPRLVPKIGGQILDQSVKGRSKMRVKLEWKTKRGRYP